MSWQTDLRRAADEERARLAERDVWVVRATEPRLITQVWCKRTRPGVAGQDLALIATCYEFYVSASFQTCADGEHVYCEFDPPVEALRVVAERMTAVVTALRESGYHAHCSNGHGKEYDF